MKNILFLILFISYNAFGQSTSHVYYEKTISGLSIENVEILKNQESTRHVFLSYQNIKYTHITDIGVLSFYKKSELETFIKNLKMCSKHMDNKNDNLHVNNKIYMLDVFDFSKNIYLINNKDKTIYLNKKNLLKIISALEINSLNFLK